MIIARENDLGCVDVIASAAVGGVRLERPVARIVLEDGLYRIHPRVSAIGAHPAVYGAADLDQEHRSIGAALRKFKVRRRRKPAKQARKSARRKR